MSSSSLHIISNTTPEHVFASKYAWLLRWALHFCRNDRSAAEDLVQECFVKLLMSWDKLRDVDNIEPVLYTYLKFAHLNECRRERNCSFQNLATIDFDTFFIQLRMANEADQLALQNELRGIVTYLLWRRHSAKFAAVFLLRFFHGYFPEEIMRICLITRHAVDLSLRYARQEMKSYLAKENSIQASSDASMPEVETRCAAISPHLFTEELRRTIFSMSRSGCTPKDQLLRRYEEMAPRALDCDQLAHLVGCCDCLDTVSTGCGLLPTSRRSPDDSLRSATHLKGAAGNPSARRSSFKGKLTLATSQP